EAEKRGEACAAGESSCNPCETWVVFPDNCLDRPSESEAVTSGNLARTAPFSRASRDLCRLEPQARLHIQVKGAVGVDMEVDEGGEGLEIPDRHPCAPCRIGKHMLQHERVDVD